MGRTGIYDGAPAQVQQMIVHSPNNTGLSVPEDISVVGFDDIPMASYLHRPLTTIAQPVAQMAEAASRTLLDRISGKLQGPATHQIFPTSLILRETTAAPRSRESPNC
jgi:LacI family transcriptional regulator